MLFCYLLFYAISRQADLQRHIPLMLSRCSSGKQSSDTQLSLNNREVMNLNNTEFI